MRFDTYQEQALSTMVNSVNKAGKWRPVYLSLAICGEAGELAEQVKKMVRDDNLELTKDRKKKIKGEIGDVLWYLAVFADSVGLSLDDIAKANIDKLQGRKEAGTIGGAGSDR